MRNLQGSLGLCRTFAVIPARDGLDGESIIQEGGLKNIVCWVPRIKLLQIANSWILVGLFGEFMILLMLL